MTVASYGELPGYKELQGSIPTSDTGEIRRYSVHSTHLDADIIVDVWTPEAYAQGGEHRYPVLYAHDGQNLFDSSYTFAGVAWEVDRTAGQLGSEKEIVTPIVVGINNRGSDGLRACDYFPEKVIDYIPAADRDKTKIFETCRGKFLGDEEAAFVATELKPLIDYLYTTNPTQPYTFAMGSSMGGLASLYLLCEYPDIFHGAACMSTHWVGSLDLNPDYTMNDDPVCAKAILAYMDANLPSPATHKLYLDQGTSGWDAMYLKYEATAREIAVSHGYSIEGGTLETYDDKGAGHNEWFWQQRLSRPLKFMFSNSSFEDAGIDTPVLDGLPAEGGTYINLHGISYPENNPAGLLPGIYLHGGKKILVK